jgi:hypothetical protein
MSKKYSAVSSRNTYTAPPPAPPQEQVNRISIPDAIRFLNQKIVAMETFMNNHVKQMEGKMGEHENYISENTPDVELINKVFSDINKRLLDVESLEERISKLEQMVQPDKSTTPTTPTSPIIQTPIVTKPTKKKGGTIKLDMDQKLQNPSESIGISFS